MTETIHIRSIFSRLGKLRYPILYCDRRRYTLSAFVFAMSGNHDQDLLVKTQGLTPFLRDSLMKSDTNHEATPDELRSRLSSERLCEKSIPDNPFDLFQTWFNEALSCKVMYKLD